MNVVDSALCSPQCRQRVFWTNFPIKSLTAINIPETQLINVLEPLETVIQKYQQIRVSDRFVLMYNKIMNEKNAERTILAERIDRNYENFSLWKTNIVNNQPRSRWQKYPFSDSAHAKSKTITTNHPNHHIIDRRFSEDGNMFVVRQFLAEELERLFNFPNGWTDHSRPDGSTLSNNERTEMLGNSIVVSVAKHLLLSATQQ
jgi:hypothetical protein